MITRRELLQYTAATAAAAAVGQVNRAEAQAGDAPLFPGFKSAKIKTSGATLNLVSGGKGSPVLLMHGYPQTHVKVTGKALPERHFLPEEAPQQTLAALQAFLSA